MDDLIKALQIIAKYNNEKYPTHCEHDMLCVPMDTDQVTPFDKEQLKRLGFNVYEEGFLSYRFGSC